MWAGVDDVGGRLLDAALAAAILAALGAGAVVVCRQPARRVRLVRALIAALLLLIPLKVLDLLPTLSLSGPLASVLGIGSEALPRSLRVAWLARGLTIAYGGGLLFGLAWLALGHVGLAWLVRRSHPAGPVGTEIYEELLASWGGKRTPPGLRVSSRVKRPVIVSRVVGSMILIPPSLDPESRDDLVCDTLRLGLLHELAHAEAGDPRHILLGRLAQGFWFFLPPVWWLTSVMRLDQEFLADRLAARRFGTPGDYASRLLDIASSSDHSAIPLPASEPSCEAEQVPDAEPEPYPESAPPARSQTFGSALFYRMRMLLHCPFAIELEPPRWWVGSVVVATVLLTLGSATLSLRPEDNAPIDRTSTTAFQLMSLVVPAQPSGSLGRAPLFELPLMLPEQFDLSLEVWGDAESLALTRVAGLPLALLGKEGTVPTDSRDGADWHTVRIRRDGRGGITLQLDDRPLLVPAGSLDLTTWLSLEAPPGQEGRFRFLNLVW
ncbi:MAG: M56 family metallopeptidase [Isosphaeraceae bacterium]